MTTSYLIAVDGSEPSARAVEQAITDAASRKLSPHLYLVNVQPALPPNVTRFIDAETVDDFQRETGDQALASAKDKLMERFPIIVTLGAALIGWVGGETLASDVALQGLMEHNHWLHYAAAACGSALVIGVGRLLQKRKASQNLASI